MVVDMPAGTPLERTAAAALQDIASTARDPVVRDIQAYAGTGAPINFNGLVRQYDLRNGGEMGSCGSIWWPNRSAASRVMQLPPACGQ